MFTSLVLAVSQYVYVYVSCLCLSVPFDPHFSPSPSVPLFLPASLSLSPYLPRSLSHSPVSLPHAASFPPSLPPSLFLPFPPSLPPSLVKRLIIAMPEVLSPLVSINILGKVNRTSGKRQSPMLKHSTIALYCFSVSQNYVAGYVMMQHNVNM